MEMKKVIKEYEEFVDKYECFSSSDDYVLEMHKAVLALLKEHEHGETFTVIDTKTGKVADEYEIALHEDWAKDLCYCDMDGWAIMDDGTLLLVDECGRCAYADRERFKVVWDD
jgi:hypothetical protein